MLYVAELMFPFGIENYVIWQMCTMRRNNLGIAALFFEKLSAMERTHKPAGLSLGCEVWSNTQRAQQYMLRQNETFSLCS